MSFNHSLMTPLLDLNRVDIAHSDSAPVLLTDISLSLYPGECHCITGNTGSGKSSLLMVLAGLGGEVRQGHLTVAKGVSRALVLQDPHTQLLRRTIGAEVAFGLENLGVPSEQMPARVKRALQRAGLDLPLNTHVATLSLGQKYRLMIAAQLVSEPDILMLDEPWAQLDDEGVDSLSLLLEKLKSEGLGLLLVEHHASAFAGLIDHWWRLESGHLFHGVDYSETRLAAPDFSPLSSATSSKTEVRLSTAAFCLKHADNSPLFAAPALQVRRGELVLLQGSNGCGKSSLLSLLAGCGESGDLPLSVLGQSPTLGIYGRDLCYLMQRPNRQLFEVTVMAELEYSLKRYGLPLERASRVMETLAISHLAGLSPHKLSYGQQHLIALASLVCLEPKIFLLDDPFAGLDCVYSQLVAILLQQLRARGCTLIIACHRPMALAQTQNWHIRNQRLEVEHVGPA